MMTKSAASPNVSAKNSGFGYVMKKDFSQHKYLYLLALPGVLFYILFCYLPMFGVVIAFQDYNLAKGVLGSKWVGLKHFYAFFHSYYIGRLIRNTLLINVYSLIFAFPIPIIFALQINEVPWSKFKKIVQTSSYLPYFISMVVVCSMVIDFTSQDGLINYLLSYLGVQSVNLLLDPAKFRTIYIVSDIWQYFGWNSIIYIAALASVDVALYEAATVDGATRLQKMWHITLPSIRPTIMIMLILRIGSMMSVGFEKIILLYNSNTYETADVIASFVYRKGLVETNYSYSAAVGLFNSVVNLVLLSGANICSRKLTETSLW